MTEQEQTPGDLEYLFKQARQEIGQMTSIRPEVMRRVRSMNVQPGPKRLVRWGLAAATFIAAASFAIWASVNLYRHNFSGVSAASGPIQRTDRVERQWSHYSYQGSFQEPDGTPLRAYLQRTLRTVEWTEPDGVKGNVIVPEAKSILVSVETY